MKRLEINELRAKIKSLAERNRLATTDEERATVAAEMNTLRSENEQAFTEALEALIKITADDVQELHGRNIKNNGSYNIVVFLTICISYANNCFTL